MLLLDDILLAPARGLLWVFEEIHHAAEEAMASETESITEELRNLYMALETHRISGEEFDAGEKALLDRLERIEARGEVPEELAEEAAASRQGPP